MSCSSGPNIIEDGLVLAIDANNIKSYPGSGLIISDLTKLSSGGTFSSLLVNQGYINCNSSSAVQYTFPQIPYTSWSIIYALRPTGTPSTDYRASLVIKDSNAVSYYYNDTRTVATPYIHHYIKDFSINSWWSRDLLNASDYTTYPWKIYACTQSGTQIKTYKNGVLLNADTITQTLTGYGDLKYLTLSPNGNHVINIGFCLIYNKTLSDAEISQNFNALRGRYNI